MCQTLKTGGGRVICDTLRQLTPHTQIYMERLLERLRLCWLLGSIPKMEVDGLEPAEMLHVGLEIVRWHKTDGRAEDEK